MYEVVAENMIDMWMTLFKAESEEEFERIEKMGVPIMNEVIKAYRQVTASPEYREIERIRLRASHDEAQALYNMERTVTERWMGEVANRDAMIANRDAMIADKNAELARMEQKIALLKTTGGITCQVEK